MRGRSRKKLRRFEVRKLGEALPRTIQAEVLRTSQLPSFPASSSKKVISLASYIRKG
jgi:hypothetical protein